MKTELNTIILTLPFVFGLKFKDLVLEPKHDILYSQYPLPKSDKNSYLSFKKNIEVDLPDNYQTYTSERDLLYNGESEYICETSKKEGNEEYNKGNSEVNKNNANLPSQIVKKVGFELSQQLSKGCIKATQNYWTYELCFKDYIKQYHIPQEGEKILNQMYFTWDQKKKNLPMHYKEDELGNYLSQTWEEGTKCDLTENSRSTEIKFVCNQGPQTKFVSIAESETCKYQIEIHVPLFCKYDKFKPQQDINSNYITLHKLVNQNKYDSTSEEIEIEKANSNPDNSNQRVKTLEIEDVSSFIDDLDTDIPTLETKLTPKDPLYLLDLASWKKKLDVTYYMIRSHQYFIDTKTKNPTQLELLEKLKRRKDGCLSAYSELLLLKIECRATATDFDINKEPFADKNRKFLKYLDTGLGESYRYNTHEMTNYWDAIESLSKVVLKFQAN